MEETTTRSNSLVYTYQGSNILFQKNLTSGTITKNYYANGLLVGENISGTGYYLLDDLLGSIRDVTTSTVSSVFSSNYKPYGSSYGLTLSLPDTFYYYYTHKPYDPSTGLYYYGARYYDPGINRFMNEDTTKYSNNQNPLTLNRYVYVVNNPERLNDPSGHEYVTSSPHGDATTTSESSQNSKMPFDEYLTFVWLTNPSNLEQIGLGLLSILTILTGPAALFLISAIAGGDMDVAAIALAGMLVSEQLIPDLAQTVEGAASGNPVKSAEGIFNLVSDSYSFLVNQLSWETKLEFFASFGAYEGVTGFLTAGTWQAGSAELAADTATGLVATWYSEAQIDYELYVFSS